MPYSREARKKASCVHVGKKSMLYVRSRTENVERNTCECANHCA
nr:MAG: hypothetical protein [Molluscum contagiosum virus]